jgi:hypothetical protein
MDITPVIDRLTALGRFRMVAGATALADALDGAAVAFPAACVIVPTDRAEKSRLVGRLRQRITSRLPVVVGIKAAAASAKGRQDDTQALVRAVIDSLTGYRLPDAASALQYQSSDVRAIDAGVVWVEVAFGFEWYLTTDNPDAPGDV